MVNNGFYDIRNKKFVDRIPWQPVACLFIEYKQDIYHFITDMDKIVTNNYLVCCNNRNFNNDNTALEYLDIRIRIGILRLFFESEEDAALVRIFMTTHVSNLEWI